MGRERVTAQRVRVDRALVGPSGTTSEKKRVDWSGMEGGMELIIPRTTLTRHPKERSQG